MLVPGISSKGRVSRFRAYCRVIKRVRLDMKMVCILIKLCTQPAEYLTSQEQVV